METGTTNYFVSFVMGGGEWVCPNEHREFYLTQKIGDVGGRRGGVTNTY